MLDRDNNPRKKSAMPVELSKLNKRGDPAIELFKQYGFYVDNHFNIQSINCVILQFRHKESGALLTVVRPSITKSFSFCFAVPTMPRDNKGKPHILEHSVLAGSKNFPSKSIFWNILSQSPASFINALTYSDATAYPFTTSNFEDFKILLNVYLDAVFNPLLTKETFDREAYNITIDKEGNPKEGGVVFNEMKGVVYSPDNFIYYANINLLKPNTTYGVISGGHPSAIRELNYQELLDFYKEFYVTQNMHIVLYGDMDFNQVLPTIDNYLKQHNIQNSSSLNNRIQTPFSKPKYIEMSYPSAVKDENVVSFNWAFDRENLSYPQVSAFFQLASKILAGFEFSLLNQNLIETGLVKDISIYYSDQVVQPTFHITCRGVEKEDIPKVRKILEQSLAIFANGKVSSDLLDISTNQVVLALEDYSDNIYASAEDLTLEIALSKFYNLGPDKLFSVKDQVKKIKSDLNFISEMAKKVFIDNNWKTEIVFLADPYFMEREKEKEESALLKKAKQLKKEGKLTASNSNNGLLEEKEVVNNKKINVEVVPLSSFNQHFTPILYRTKNNTLAITNKIADSDLVDFKVLFPLLSIDKEIFPYLYFLLSSFPAIATEEGRAEKDTERELLRLGKVKNIGVFHCSLPESKEQESFLFILAQADINSFHSFIKEVKKSLNQGTFTKNFAVNYLKRIKEVVRLEKEHKSRDKNMAKAKAYFDKRYLIDALFFGDQLIEKIDILIKEAEEDFSSFIRKLKHVISLFDWNKTRWAVAVASNNEDLLLNVDKGSFVLPQQAYNNFSTNIVGDKAQQISIQVEDNYAVNYISMATQLTDLSFKDISALLVLSKILTYDYLIPKIREEGKAYGASLRIEPSSGFIIFSSYRDPSLQSTVEAFFNATNAIKEISDDKINQAIVSALGEFDNPKSIKSILDKIGADLITGKEQERLKKLREALINLKREDIDRAINLLTRLLQDKERWALSADIKGSISQSEIQSVKDIFSL